MEMLNYRVPQISFSLNDDYDFSSQEEVRVHPLFQRRIKGIDQDRFIVRLSLSILPDAHLPFSLSVDLEGTFMIKNWRNDNNKPYVLDNSISILFPYLRSLVTMVTASAGIAPFVLPVMNITTLFNKNEDKRHE